MNLANNWERRWSCFCSIILAEPRFYQCVFDGNVLDRTGTDSQGNQEMNQDEANGGAVWNKSCQFGNSATQFILFDGCTFKNNVAKGKSGGATGGAICILMSSQVENL